MLVILLIYRNIVIVDDDNLVFFRLWLNCFLLFISLSFNFNCRQSTDFGIIGICFYHNCDRFSNVVEDN